jgi:hypothetical protein
MFRLSALLLVFSVWLGSVWMFAIQPLVGTIIRSRFGGEPADWNTALNAFAIVSCVGLLCAWLLSSLGNKAWAIGIITTGFVLLLGYFVTDDQEQRRSFHQCVASFCGAMCLLFILQVILPYWFGQAVTPAWVDPYFVLAFAHLGAMTCLIGYPFVVEPHLELSQQYLVWTIGFGVIGMLFLICTWLLRATSLVTAADSQIIPIPNAPPKWLRRFRWAVLGGLPTVLLAHGPPSPDARATIHLVMTFELTLVVAYARIPRAKPSLLAVGVQILGMIACLPSLVMVSGTICAPDEARIFASLLLGVLASALVPHRWTLLLQGAMCLTVIAITATEAHASIALAYTIHAATVAVTSWGCYGAMVQDRPGPERFAEFLFFTGLAPSVVFSFVPAIVELVTPRVAYPGIVVLAFVARFLPGKTVRARREWAEARDSFSPIADEMQPVIDTSIRVID